MRNGLTWWRERKVERKRERNRERQRNGRERKIVRRRNRDIEELKREIGEGIVLQGSHRKECGKYENTVSKEMEIDNDLMFIPGGTSTCNIFSEHKSNRHNEASL